MPNIPQLLDVGVRFRTLAVWRYPEESGLQFWAHQRASTEFRKVWTWGGRSEKRMRCGHLTSQTQLWVDRELKEPESRRFHGCPSLAHRQSMFPCGPQSPAGLRGSTEPWQEDRPCGGHHPGPLPEPGLTVCSEQAVQNEAGGRRGLSGEPRIKIGWGGGGCRSRFQCSHGAVGGSSLGPE